MLSQGSLRRVLGLLVIPIIIISTIFILQSGFYHGPVIDSFTSNSGPEEKPTPIYKAPSDPPPPIVDNFPIAANAKSASEIPKIPAWNAPPKTHVKVSTPLFIGFTRNWRLLQQTVVSYITAGWPPGDIYVIENTGVMNSNRDGLLTLQNPFYLDHHRLTKILGINVISTPTLFTFAQLQNFYVYTALEHEWDHYFWAHMDTVVVSDEEWKGEEYKSLYMRAVDALEETRDPDWGPLATLWFAYDRLALVRTKAFVDVGGWDTMIPFYMTDCDMHERLWMKEFKIEPAEAGKVWDVAESLDDLEILYKRGDGPQARSDERPVEKRLLSRKSEAQKNSKAYQDLLQKLDELQRAKADNKEGRNTWQARQKGGKGEPFYRDSDGFEKALWMWMEFGRDVFKEKWGRGPCDIRDAGLKDGDEWRVVVDWENADVQKKHKKEIAKQEKDDAKSGKQKEGDDKAKGKEPAER